MLKQSLVQEKLSDLSMAAQASAAAAVASSSSSVTASSTGPGSTSGGPSTLNGSSQADLELKNNQLTSNDLILPHVGQWPRVQLIKTTTSNIINNNKVKLKSSAQQQQQQQINQLTQSPTQQNSSTSFPKYSNQTKSNDDDNNDENIEYDGIETVNYYSHHHNNINRQRSNLNENSFNSGQNNQSNNSLNNLSNLNNQQFNNSNSNINNNSLHFQNHYNHQHSDKNIKIVSDTNQYDPTLKLKYLEKSIKFIQQQHNETLTGLHQEIEKLKNENRELHFKLATRKSSSSLKDSNTNSITSFKQESDRHHNKTGETTIKDLKTNEELLSDKIEQRGFDKALKDALKERNIEKRLNDIKLNYEANKYEDLFTRLVDAENKNEYLTSIITQLQSKRSINSGYRSNVNVNNQSNNQTTTNTTTTTTTTNNTSTTTPATTTSTATPLIKININQIYSVEPLRIKLNDSEEPRAPSLEESEVIIKKLFELYKQQKQQISNMKVVLKDMMHNENLSSQAMMMTKDLLDNPNRFTHYILDNSNIHKLSVLAPLTNYTAPKSSNGRLNYNTQRYHSQLVNGAGYDSLPTATSTATTSSNINLSSIVHLPPLQTMNPAKFPERQRRTQILQRQRLRKEYFH